VHDRVGKTLEHIGIDNNFLNRTPIAQQLRERIEKCDYKKLKGFCTAKELVTRLKKAAHRRGEKSLPAIHQIRD
jgi:hypothetical protein